MTMDLGIPVSPDELHRGHPGWVGADAFPELVQRGERGSSASDQIFLALLEASGILHGDEHGEWLMIALDEEPLAGGRLIQDPAQRASQIEGRDRPHRPMIAGHQMRL